jgi:prolyl 4-hydroxylase
MNSIVNGKAVLRGSDLFTVEGLVDAAWCAEKIADAESRGLGPAPISTGFGAMIAPKVRNNTRVMYDDAPCARRLWQLLRPYVPERLGLWRALGLNERLRIYRYGPGQQFRWHHDGSFVRSGVEQSLLTVMLYLNDDFEGGSTDFDDGERFSVRPRTGMFLVFEHPRLHQGSVVTRGAKYVLRSDVMYRRE